MLRATKISDLLKLISHTKYFVELIVVMKNCFTISFFSHYAKNLVLANSLTFPDLAHERNNRAILYD